MLSCKTASKYDILGMLQSFLEALSSECMVTHCMIKQVEMLGIGGNRL